MGIFLVMVANRLNSFVDGAAGQVMAALAVRELTRRMFGSRCWSVLIRLPSSGYITAKTEKKELRPKTIAKTAHLD